MTLSSQLRLAYMRTTTPSSLGRGNRRYVRHLYTLWSRFYDRSIGLDPAFRDNAARMIDRAVHQGDRTLDVGVGTGLLAELGADRAALWVGLDYSGAMLAEAARKMAAAQWANVRLCWGDARKLPFSDGEFDSVVSSFVLPHFATDEKLPVLREMGRVLRPSGRLGLFLAQGEKAPLFITRPRLESLLSESGFVEVGIEDRDDVYRIVTAIRGVEHDARVSG